MRIPNSSLRPSSSACGTSFEAANHPTDVLSEPIQNAVDEVEEAVRQKAIDRGNVTVSIDCSNGKVTVTDNGRGMSTDLIKRLLGPDATGKSQSFHAGQSRGCNKGVGLTFMAYGFNFFEIESRTSNEHFAVRIKNASNGWRTRRTLSCQWRTCVS